MSAECRRELGLIAGRGTYPLELAASAKQHGVARLVVVAFRGETYRAIARWADELHWVRLGRLQDVLDTLQASGVRQAVVAGQITPTHLFNLRFDRKCLAVLRELREKNAHTLFTAFANELRALGIELLPAYLFMEAAMPPAGPIGGRPPTPEEWEDMRLGFRVAKLTSGLDIGQTVVVKRGTILAVEAFEGTDATIRRAGRLGGPGAVVVKVAKQGHDMRFDIPVVGLRTLRILRKIRAGALALEAQRTLLLEREALIHAAERMGLSMVAISADEVLKGPSD